MTRRVNRVASDNLWESFRMRKEKRAYLRFEIISYLKSITMKMYRSVRLIVDHSFAQVSGSLVSELRKRGAFVRSKKSDYLMHHKFAIIDGRLILSGNI